MFAKALCIVRTPLLLLALVAAAGCSDPANKTIDQLGGTPDEVKAAEMEITMMEPPPVDALSARLKKPGDAALQTNVAVLLGKIAAKYTKSTITMDDGGSQTGEKAVDALIDCVKNGNSDQQAACARGLGEAGSERGFKALHPLTLHKEPAPRQAAMEVLGEQVANLASEARELAAEEKVDETFAKIEQALTLYPSSGEAITLMAEAQELLGDTEAYEEWMGKLGTLKQYHLLGPLPPRTLEEMGKDIPAAWKTPGGDAVEGHSGMEVHWQEVEPYSEDGYLDVGEVLYGPPASAMLVANVTPPPSGDEYLLSLRFRERARVWVNDTSLFTSEAASSDKWDEVRIPVLLRPGGNQIRILLAQDNGLWGTAVRVLNTDGSPVESLTVE